MADLLLAIPRLDDLRIRDIAFCGQLSGDAPNRINPPIPSQTIIATASGPLYIRLIIGGPGKPITHLHIDLVRPTAFPMPPVVNGTLEKIGEAISPMYGEKITMKPFVNFVIPKEDFPSTGFAAQAKTSGKIEGYEIQQAMGGYTFSGSGRLTKIEWKEARDNNRNFIVASVTCKLETKLEPDYLIKAHAILDPIYRKWFFGESVGG